MKFSSTVDALSRENINLRLLALVQAVASLTLGVAIVLFHDRAAVVVERSARGLEMVRATPLRRTREDIEQAIDWMLKARLDTGAASPEVYLTERQTELRKQEQRELKSRGIDQEILIRAIETSNGSAVAEIDRVLRVGDIRSAVKTKVSLEFEEVEPNELNPYGLKLSTLTPIVVEEKHTSGSNPPAAPPERAPSKGGSSK